MQSPKIEDVYSPEAWEYKMRDEYEVPDYEDFIQNFGLYKNVNGRKIKVNQLLEESEEEDDDEDSNEETQFNKTQIHKKTSSFS